MADHINIKEKDTPKEEIEESISKVSD